VRVPQLIVVLMHTVRYFAAKVTKGPALTPGVDPKVIKECGYFGASGCFGGCGSWGASG
jgi:hypothetical protein